MPSKRPPLATLLAPIPNTPGVYLFFGTQNELLYVGKSKTLKARVRAHFRDRSERMMMSRVRKIETRDTAGELGALLLESRLIKELKPMFNRAQRQRRRIVIAERRTTPQGYTAVHLRSVDAVDPRKSGEILGVFKHTTQAKEFLEKAVKERKLCPILLGLEQGRKAVGGERDSAFANRQLSIVPANRRRDARRPQRPKLVGQANNAQSTLPFRRPCFSYHLGQCAGACVGEEAPGDYNVRVEAAFEERRIVAWPYGRGLVIRERRQEKGGRRQGLREEIFLVDNWVLVGSLTKQGDALAPFAPSQHRFDYDTYKIMYSFVAKPVDGQQLRTPSAKEWKQLLAAAGG